MTDALQAAAAAVQNCALSALPAHLMRSRKGVIRPLPALAMAQASSIKPATSTCRRNVRNQVDRLYQY